MTRTARTRRRPAPVPVTSAAASVITWRLAMLARMVATPTAARRREAVRMVAEKLAAAVEAAVAMPLEAARQARSLCVGPRTERRWIHAGRRILRAGSAPFHRRVRANARRLGRRRSM